MKKYYSPLLLVLLIFILGCKKDFLGIKSEKSQVVPSSISDYQAILDNANVMNMTSSTLLGMLGADEYYIMNGRLSTISSVYQKNGYVWGKDVYQGTAVDDWNFAYRRILYSNISLEGISKINPHPGEQEGWNNVKGSALFYRAFNFYQLAQLFCKPFDASSSPTDPGIPLRTESDINIKSTRATVAAAYKQIINDLSQAIELLPLTPLVKYRPSKSAALALLAKTSLIMGDYEKARTYAVQCLAIKDELIDFNNIDGSLNYPFPENVENNPEILFYNLASNITILGAARFNADTTLLNSYAANDLRKQAYFFEYTGRILFGGGYIPGGYFTGLATDEILLIRAECHARLGDGLNGLNDLNTLLKSRINRSSFVPLSFTDADDVLASILKERRKELVLRGTRWEDLRRLNKEPRFATTLVRNIDNQRFELFPNDPRYTWPIPDSEVTLNGLKQNIR